MKNSSGQSDETQVTSEIRTRSVRSLGTAELIRPQKLKYFESMSNYISFVILLADVMFLSNFCNERCCFREINCPRTWFFFSLCLR